MKTSYRSGQTKTAQCTVHSVNHDPTKHVALEDHCGIKGLKDHISNRKPASTSSLLDFFFHVGSQHHEKMKPAVKRPAMQYGKPAVLLRQHQPVNPKIRQAHNAMRLSHRQSYCLRSSEKLTRRRQNEFEFSA